MRWFLRLAKVVVLSVAFAQAMFVEHHAIRTFPLPIATAIVAATATTIAFLLLLVAGFHQIGIIVFLPVVAVTSVLWGMPAALLLPGMLAISGLWRAGDESPRKKKNR